MDISANCPEVDAIRAAERIVYREKWRVCEERAAQRLASTRSLRWTRLFPESRTIQVVAIDGVVIGQVRRNGRRWIAIRVGDYAHIAETTSFRLAILAVACECAPW